MSEYPNFKKTKQKFLNKAEESRKTRKYGNCSFFAGRVVAVLIIVITGFIIAKCLESISSTIIIGV